MRIGIIVKDFPPDVIGGMELQTKRMATELQESGHQVTVFTKQYNGCIADDVDYDVVRLPNVRLNPFISTTTFLIVCLAAILRRRRDLDCLQCMMLYPVGFLGYAANLLTGTPYFAWIRGGDYYLMRGTNWKRWMMKVVLKDTLVLVQAADIREDVLNDFAGIASAVNIELLGNGVDIPKKTADGDTVLYVGRLAEKKGLQYLLDAMKIVNESGWDPQFQIVGDGDQKSRLENHANEIDLSVEFIGQVPHENLSKYYSEASIFVIPSTEGEGLPNSVLEAMSWEIPVVATNSGGLPTLINDGETGFVVEMADPEALASKIITLLDDTELRERLGRNARNHVQSQYSWNRIVAELESIYEEMVEFESGSDNP